MLLATGNQNQNYENLANYLTAAASPLDVRAENTPGGVRQPLPTPTSKVPTVETPIRTSSARPSKATNARIVYTRVSTVQEENDASLEEGNVVYVNRLDGTSGGGHNFARTSRVHSLAQMNARLSEHELGITTTSPSDDGKHDAHVFDETARWPKCSFLRQWVPDGLLVGKERDGDGNATNSGAAYNIAVSGPSLLQNTFDNNVRNLDKVFVGVVAKQNFDENNNLSYFSYKLRIFSSRQLLNAQIRANEATPPPDQSDSSGGDGGDSDFLNIVEVWRIGSVLDTRSGSLAYRCATLNVVVEQWTLETVSTEFHKEFARNIK